MGLADRYVKPDTRTKFEKWLDGLNEKNRGIVLSWLRDSTISNISIASWIRDDDPEDDFTGYRANKDTIAEWRRANGVFS